LNLVTAIHVKLCSAAIKDCNLQEGFRGGPACLPRHNDLSGGCLDDNFGFLRSSAGSIDIGQDFQLGRIVRTCTTGRAKNPHEAALSAAVSAINDGQALDGKRQRRRLHKPIDVRDITNRFDLKRRRGGDCREMRLR
jgi:hypothetical protein